MVGNFLPAFMNLALRKIGFSPLRKLSVYEGHRNSTKWFKEWKSTNPITRDSSLSIGALQIPMNKFDNF